MKKLVLLGLVMAFMVTLCGCATKGDCKKTSKFAMRVNCGATEAYIDTEGNNWNADQMIGVGKTWGSTYGMGVDRGDLNITGVPAPKIYETECYSMSNYKFTEIPNGKYTIRLHFAETFEGVMAAGGRLFGVTINGKTVATDYDPFKEGGGSNKPSVKECKGIEVTDGTIIIGFVENEQNPEINGIEILGE